MSQDTGVDPTWPLVKKWSVSAWLEPGAHGQRREGGIWGCRAQELCWVSSGALAMEEGQHLHTTHFLRLPAALVHRVWEGIAQSRLEDGGPVSLLRGFKWLPIHTSS